MKKYLFGLGAMLIGAGLMFVLTHTDVSAWGKPFDKKPDCKLIGIEGEYNFSYCKIEDLTCVTSQRGSNLGGISCVKTD